MFLGSSDGLFLVEVKEVVFIPEKSVHLSRLGALFLELSDGSWELDACRCLIGDLDDALPKSAFQGCSHIA